MRKEGIRIVAYVLVCIILALVGCTENKGEEGVTDKVAAARAYHKQGLSYDSQWQMRLAEMYYKKAYTMLCDNPAQDWKCYADAGYRYAYLMMQRGAEKDGLAIVSDILKRGEGEADFPAGLKMSLVNLMGDCQLRLNQVEEAKKTFVTAYEEKVKADGGKNLGDINMVIACSNLFQVFYAIDDYDEATKWLQRSDEEFRAYVPKGDSLLIEEYRGHLALDSAVLLQATGHGAEAAAVYASVPKSRIFNPTGFADAALYLMAAGRYGECADIYARLDTTYMHTDSLRHSLDVVSTYISPRYVANRKAGRDDEALRIADMMCNAIDSAVVWERQNGVAELAVIYETHEKELALNDAKAETLVHRVLLAATVLVILLIAFQLRHAHYYNKELMAKNRKLYEEIERHRMEQQQEMEQLQAAPEAELNGEQQLYRRLCQLMDDQHPYTDEALNRDMLAQILGTNAKYVVQAIRECSHGETVNDFINRYRLEHVARLLKTTDEPIAIIGEMAGIPSRATLARLFRNAYGMTPTEYRKI